MSCESLGDVFIYDLRVSREVPGVFHPYGSISAQWGPACGVEWLAMDQYLLVARENGRVEVFETDSVGKLGSGSNLYSVGDIAEECRVRF